MLIVQVRGCESYSWSKFSWSQKWGCGAHLQCLMWPRIDRFCERWYAGAKAHLRGFVRTCGVRLVRRIDDLWYFGRTWGAADVAATPQMLWWSFKLNSQVLGFVRRIRPPEVNFVSAEARCLNYLLYFVDLLIFCYIEFWSIERGNIWGDFHYYFEGKYFLLTFDYTSCFPIDLNT